MNMSGVYICCAKQTLWRILKMKSMESNPFELQFKEISDEALLERLSEKDEYQPLAQQAMVNEAMSREIILNKTEDAIAEAIANFQEKNTKSRINKHPNQINWSKIIYYSFGYLFLSGGILMIFNFFDNPLVTIIISLFLFSLSYFFFRLPKSQTKIKSYNITEKARKDGLLRVIFYQYLAV